MMLNLLKNEWKKKEQEFRKKRRRRLRKTIEEDDENLEDDIPTDIHNKLRDEEIESHKKEYQEQKLHLIKVEEEYKAELARTLKKRVKRISINKRLRLFELIKNSKRLFEELMNIESFEPLSLTVLKKT
jgi:hypothetical protein